MLSELHKSKLNTEFWLVIFTATLGVMMFFWVSDLGLLKSLTDQNAHLNATKLAFDSMTPGISQIGFWPPLLHILMMPFIAFQSLYSSGSAGAFVLIPALCVAAVFLYRLALLYTNDKILSFIAALLLVTNPYILYYSVTPMMEILFLANLFGTAYFLALWLKHDRLVYLLACAGFISLTCLSRFEGLILIPLITLIVLVQLIKKRKEYSEVEALMLLFLILAGLGLVGIVTFSWVFSGNPLMFTGGSWLKNPTEATLPTKHNLMGSLVYMLYASFYMLSKPFVLLSVASFVMFAIFSGRRFNSIAVLSVLFSPFFFIAATLFAGTGSIAVADLPPFDFFSNERYSLTWIGFVIMTPILLIGMIGYYFSLSKRRWLNFSGLFVKNTLALGLLILAFQQFYSVTFVEKFAVIRQNINSPLQPQVEVSGYFQENYDFGKILITKADNDPILASAGVPLRNYIYEGNYLYFEQSNDEPWLFARFVVMHNLNDPDEWAAQNETIMRTWANNKQFADYYDLVLENQTRRVYKINEQKVRAMALDHNLNVSEIPSINANIAKWDPTDVYGRIQNSQVGVSEVKKN